MTRGHTARRLSAGVLVGALALLGAGCGGDDDDDDAAQTPTSTEAPEGGFGIKVVYDEPLNEEQAAAREILQLGGTDGVAEGFTQNFAFPTDVTIYANNTPGSPNYDPSTKTVNLYYDFVSLTGQILLEGQPDLPDEEYGKQLAAVGGFILVHELGHAFVDVFEIPITGREEDAVDGMATSFLAGAVENGEEYAFDAARFFNFLQDYQGTPDAAQFADEHSLSIQRALDIVCKVAGASEESLQDIYERGILPEERLAQCPAEYEQVSSAWQKLLEPHLRNPN